MVGFLFTNVFWEYLYYMKFRDILTDILHEQIDPITFGKNVVNTLMNRFKPKSTPKPKPLPFSLDNLKTEIKKQGIVYPDVALAQAKWESTHFTSNIFLDNHNLFGMKLARQRDTTAIGMNRNHAKYKNWQDSVKDYRLWQLSNGMDKLPRDKYIIKLSDNYCPPPDCPKGQYSKNILSMLK